MVSGQKGNFAEPFYRQYRKRRMRAFTGIAVGLVASGAVALAFTISWWNGHKGVALAAIALATFAFVVYASCKGVRPLSRARLVPYFEKPIGQKHTWLSGQNILSHSRELEELALKLSVRPLSEFSSGDDIAGETLHWHSPDEAIKTIDSLLRSETTPTIPVAVSSELSLVRAALDKARGQRILFCFLVRVGDSASGLEMDRRKGSFF